MSPDGGADEYEEVQHEVEKAEANDDLESGTGTVDNSSKGNQQQSRSIHKSLIGRLTTFIRRYISAIFIQAFIMTFLAVSI